MGNLCRQVFRRKKGLLKQDSEQFHKSFHGAPPAGRPEVGAMIYF
jgi:hypothetical protein